MVALLTVLLYLALIFSPGTYTTTTIYTIEHQHQAQVDAVESDPYLYNQVKIQYAEAASRIHVTDDIEH